MSKITRVDIENFSASLRTTKIKRKKTLAVGSVNEVLRPLRLILKEAATELGFVSPMEELKFTQIGKTGIAPLTLGEVEAFLKNVRADYRNYYTIRFFTGLKTSEAHGLKWKYVDFDTKTIWVREILVGRKMDLETNPQLQRCVNICDRVMAALRRQYTLTGTTDFVFYSTQGRPLSSTQVSKEIWFPTLQALKLTKRHPNQIRHTAAALFLAAGENPAWVARQMGYAYTANFIITYWEYLPYAVDANGAAFNKMVSDSSHIPS